MRHIRLLLLILMGLSLSPFSALAQEKPLTSEEQAKQTVLLGCLDKHLNLPDLSKTDIVRVINLAWEPWAGMPMSYLPANKIEYGFLLKEDKNTFTVLFTTTLQLTLRHTKSPNSAHFKKMDAKTFLKQWFQPYKESDWFDRDRALYFGNQKWVRPTAPGASSDRLDALFFTRYYMARGEQETANRFYQFYLDNDEYARKSNADVKHLAGMLSSIRTHHLEYAIMDPFLSRETVLEQMLLTLRRYPSKSTLRVGEWARTLLKMIEEDRIHAQKHLPPLSTMRLKERVAELIFRLRDALHPTREEHFMGYPYDESFKSNPLYNADKQLFQIGYPAIPQLIAAFGDKRFTRGKDTIGSRAETIFSQITSENFNSLYKNQSSYLGVKDYQRVAWAWWADFQKRGEKGVLIERTKKGDRDSLAFGERLFETYPTETLPALIVGFENAKDPAIRASFIKQLANFRVHKVTQLTRSAMWNDQSLQVRLAALRERCEEGDLEALKAMLSIWNHPEGWNGDSREKDELVSFLAYAYHPDAVRALRTRLTTMSSSQLSTVIDAPFSAFPAPFTPAPTGNIKAEQLRVRKAYEQEVETLLIQTLAREDDITAGRLIRWNTKTVTLASSSGRACDIVGAMLAFMRPDKYHFSLSAPLRKREIQRIALLNQIRNEQGLPPLPIPPLPTQQVPQNVVSQVLFAHDTPPLPAPLREKLTTLQGVKLDGKMLTERLSVVLQSLPAGIHGFYTEVDSMGDGTGVRLFFHFQSLRFEGERLEGGEVSGDISALTEKRSIGSISFSSSGKEIDAEVTRSLERALALPPNKPFEITLNLKRG